MWNRSSVFIASMVVLLNNTIFAIPNYILPVMNLPNTILDSVSKLAHNYLWGRTSNNIGFYLVG